MVIIVGSVVTHFGVPASQAFVRSLGGLAAEPPRLAMYEASKLAR